MSAHPLVLAEADAFRLMNIATDAAVVWFVGRAPSLAPSPSLPPYDLWADRWSGNHDYQKLTWAVNEQRADGAGRRWQRHYVAVMSEFGELVEVDECPVL